MSFKSILNDFQRKIKDVQLTSEQFSALNTDEERIRFSYSLFWNDFSKLTFKRSGKCRKKSRDLREIGNNHFRKNDLWKAVYSYTESLANAPVLSEEFFLALGNRSAALLRLNLVKEALADVKSVLAMAIPQELRNKMLQRKEKCLTSAGNSGVNYPVHSDFAQTNKSSFLTSASKVVEMKQDETFGRSLVVSDHVKTGEVLVIEKPFSSILVPAHLYTHCTYCFNRSFNLIPCPNCNTNMYCGEECRTRSEKQHTIECKILECLVGLQATALELLSVRVLIDASQEGQKLDELYTELSACDKGNTKQLLYNSDDHVNIYRLVGNTNRRNISDLFHKSFISCLILYLVDTFTEFFHSYYGKEKENKIFFSGSLILRYLQSMPCNAHEISEYCDDGYEEIGAGVYATLSLINHSCDPNVVRHCYRNVIALRSIRPIKKGEQLFDNYGFHYATQTLPERQNSLASQYYFHCQCEGCYKKWPLQQDLPESQPIFKENVDLKKYGLLTKAFKENVEKIFIGDYENCVTNELMQYLDFLDEYVERPWKDYNICQEAIKHCLGVQGNCFRESKGVQKS